MKIGWNKDYLILEKYSEINLLRSFDLLLLLFKKTWLSHVGGHMCVSLKTKGHRLGRKENEQKMWENKKNEKSEIKSKENKKNEKSWYMQ